MLRKRRLFLISILSFATWVSNGSVNGAQSSSALHSSQIIDLKEVVVESAPAKELRTGSANVNILSGIGAKYVEVTGYKSADGLFEATVKRYDKVALRLVDWPIDEFMYFTSGQVEIADSSGLTRRFGKGDAIVIPKGFNGEWRQLGTVTMYTVTRAYKK